MAIREGAWDCPHCGRKKNRGPSKFCGGCGAPRGEDVRFYLPEDAGEVTDEAALQRSRIGPDWICPYCEGDNPADNSFCSGCGAPRDGAKTRQVVEHRTPPPIPQAATPPPLPLASPSPKSGLWKKGCGIGCLGLVLILGLLMFLGRARETALTVEGVSWERTVPVEALRTVTEEAWEDQLPAGARVLSRNREIRGYNKVQTGTQTKTRTVSERVQTGTESVKVGTRDLGNGYFEDVYEERPVYSTESREESYEEPVYRQDPIYAIKVRYEIDKWVTAREEKAAAEDQSPEWPALSLAENEREGARKETYEVRFVDADGDRFTYKPADESEWRSFAAGSSVRAEVRPGGEVVRILGPPEE